MAKYKITLSGKFKKDFKRYRRRPRELDAIAKALEFLENGSSSIPQSMGPHKLIGNYRDLWECHAMPDLLLIWEQEDEPINEIHLIRLGSHSEVF